MRIAQNGFVEVIKKVNMLILAMLFKVKLKNEEMVIKARPASDNDVLYDGRVPMLAWIHGFRASASR